MKSESRVGGWGGVALFYTGGCQEVLAEKVTKLSVLGAGPRLSSHNFPSRWEIRLPFSRWENRQTVPQGHITWKGWTMGFNPETWGVGDRFSKVVGLIKTALDY